MRVVQGHHELEQLVGHHLGWSAPMTITQDRIDAFAAATGDHQWIHVDPVKAADGPYGTTIAHGYLTLSLLNLFLPTLWEVRGFDMGVNYGAERVRFPAPVPVDSTIRGGFTVDAVAAIVGGISVQLTGTIEVVDAPKPACVAQVVYRYYK